MNPLCSEADSISRGQLNVDRIVLEHHQVQFRFAMLSMPRLPFLYSIVNSKASITKCSQVLNILVFLHKSVTNQKVMMEQ